MDTKGKRHKQNARADQWPHQIHELCYTKEIYTIGLSAMGSRSLCNEKYQLNNKHPDIDVSKAW